MRTGRVKVGIHALPDVAIRYRDVVRVAALIDDIVRQVEGQRA